MYREWSVASVSQHWQDDIGWTCDYVKAIKWYMGWNP